MLIDLAIAFVLAVALFAPFAHLYKQSSYDSYRTG